MDGLSEDLVYVKTVLGGLADEHVRRGHQLPRSVLRARDILDRAVAAWAHLGQPDSGDASDLEQDDWIGPVEAAKLAGCDRRTLNRRPEDFGGKLVAGRLVFNRNELDGVLDGSE